MSAEIAQTKSVSQPALVVVRRWLQSIGIILCLFCIEGLTLRSMGFLYHPPQSVTHYWIPKDSLSVASSGTRCAARTFMRRQQGGHGCEVGTILVDLDEQRSVQSCSPSARSETIAISPNGTWVAISQLDGSIQVVGYENQTFYCSLQVDVDEPLLRMLFSPNDTYLAALGEYHVYLWNWSEKKLLWKQTRTAKLPDVLAFSTDSKSVLFQKHKRQLVSCDTQHGESIDSVFIDSHACLAAVWSELARDWLLVLQERQGLSIRQARTEDPYLFLREAQTGPAACIALAKDRIAYKNMHGQVAIRSLITGKYICDFSPATTMPLGLAFARKETLVCWDIDGNICRYDADTGVASAKLYLGNSADLLIKN